MATFTQAMSGGVTLDGKWTTNDPVVVITSIVQQDLTSFKIAFRSQRTPPVSFRVVREGDTITSFTSSTGNGSVVLTVGSGESPYFEILDNDNQRPHDAYSGDATLQWRVIEGASSYAVQEFIDSEWTTEQTVTEDGTNNHLFVTRWLEDSQLHQFQVVPIDASGHAGTPITRTIDMVRTPDVPSVSYTFNAMTGTVTIAAV